MAEREVVWASDFYASTEIKHLSALLRVGMGESHWSRMFEYPWVMRKAQFNPRDIVLDAGGGEGLLQYLMACQAHTVFNVDSSYRNLWRATKTFNRNRAFYKVVHQIGDLTNLRPFGDGFFDKVVCVSVLEHVPEVEQAIVELWRVLRPGGRFLITMDVTQTIRCNHSIDFARAEQVLNRFEMTLPPPPADILDWDCKEYKPGPGEDSWVKVQCLCFYCDKDEI